MALATQSSQVVWKKVQNALAGASPAAQEAFRNLKVYMATQKKNPDLQFLSWTASGALAASGTGTMASSTGGVAGIAGTGTIYAVYAKKNGTGTTAAYFRIDDATNNETGTTKNIFAALFKNVGDEAVYMNPLGTVFTVDICATSCTTNGGTTETTGASDSQDGFCVIGA